MAMQIGWDFKGEHSKAVSNASYSLVDKEMRDLVGMFMDGKSEGTLADNKAVWAASLRKIRKEYRNSVRFTLMRFFYMRNGDGTDREKGFSVRVKNETIVFPQITAEHAYAMRRSELEAYEKLLIDTAERKLDMDLNEVPDGERAQERKKRLKRAQALIARALEIERRAPRKSLLSRNELLELGHTLDFSLDEMNAFLLRTLDFEDGFFFRRSADLIEAYTFLTHSSAQSAERLKKEYTQRAEVYRRMHPNTTLEPLEEEFTRNLRTSLLWLVTQWPTDQSRDECFLSWMETKSFWLDRPSSTALRVYRNLAKAAYELICGIIKINASNQSSVNKTEALQNLLKGGFAAKVELLVQKKDDCLKGKEAECERIAKDLVAYNAKELGKKGNDSKGGGRFSDLQKAWGGIRLGKNNTLTITWRFGKDGRTRVLDLLNGHCSPTQTENVQPYGVQKEDMLYLLWVFANIYWSNEPILGKQAIRKRMEDFVTAADAVLKGALLPEFYIPHVLEQSMLRSIIYAGAVTRDGRPYQSPAQNYQDAREEIPASRNRQSKKEKSANSKNKSFDNF